MLCVHKQWLKVSARLEGSCAAYPIDLRLPCIFRAKPKHGVINALTTTHRKQKGPRYSRLGPLFHLTRLFSAFC